VKVLHRVLVVEDHEPFRRVLRALLQQRPDVLIVGEAANGLDAVRQTEALRPDLVVLDIGLPLLNGIEAAVRIRAAVPETRVMFVTVESSFEIVEQALSSGAHGYVYKARAQRDLLPVLDAIVRGGRFVCGGLERIARGDSLAVHRHHVLFCSSDAVFIDGCSRFVAGFLNRGNAVIVAVSEAHDRSLRHRLQESQVDIGLAMRQQRYVPLNIDEALARTMVNGWPDPTGFQNATEDMVTEAAQRATSLHPEVATCGECSATLWAQGHVEAAIQLEHLWDELSKSRQMDTLCAYPLTVREESARAVRSLCAEHTASEIT
jgi:CheY-like chemotaxis protein